MLSINIISLCCKGEKRQRDSEQISIMLPNVESIFEKDHGKLNSIAAFLVCSYINKMTLKIVYKCEHVCGYIKGGDG